MRKPLFLILVMLLSIPFRMVALELVSEVSRLTSPKVSVEQDEMGINVSYDISCVMKTEDDLFSKTYRLTIPGFAASINEGEPCLLQKWDTFEIPEGCDAVVEETELDYYSDKFDIAPARKPLVDSSDESYSLRNVQPVQKFAGWKPERNVSEGYVEVYRDRRLLRVGVFPVSYNIVSGEVRIAQKISYHITFKPSSAKALGLNEGVIHDIDEDVFDRMLTYNGCCNADEKHINEVDKSMTVITPWSESPWYLIITVPKYIEAVNKFVEWKKCMGYNVLVKVPSSGSWTASKIAMEISSEYRANKALKYVVLIGAGLEVPSISISGQYPCLSDYPYVCMDGGNDKLADLCIGRISVTTLAEAENVVDKIIYYEKNKRFSDVVLHCAEFSDIAAEDSYEDRRFTKTSEDIAGGSIQKGHIVERVYYYNNHSDYISTDTSILKNVDSCVSKLNIFSIGRPLYWNNGVFSYGEPIPDLLKASTFNWKGDANSVLRAMNYGMSYVLHRGHGTKSGWVYPSFEVEDVNNLSNGHSTPVVFNIDCLTGQFPQSLFGTPCFAESLLRKADGGAVSVVAASATSYSGYNDVLIMELFQMIWPDAKVRCSFPGYMPATSTANNPIYKIGELINLAKVRLNQYYKNDDEVNECTRMIYHCFGDPGMELQESFVMEPDITYSAMADSQSALGVTHIFNSPEIYTWIKINRSTGLVSSYRGRSLSFTTRDMVNNMFYVLSYGVPPTLVSKFIGPSKKDSGKIRDAVISPDLDELKICYDVIDAETGNTKIVFSDLFSGSIREYDISHGDGYVALPIENLKKGVFVISLLHNDVVLDNVKIMI